MPATYPCGCRGKPAAARLRSLRPADTISRMRNLRLGRWTVALWGAAALAAAGCAAVLLLDRGGGDAGAAPRTGGSPGTRLAARLHAFPVDRRVPDLPLVGADGRPVSLAAYRGRIVVLTPILTLCGEVCPMTTGAFMDLRQQVARDGLARKVVFVEVTVDPWRDAPWRLRAYARLTGARVPMLTGSRAQIAAFWRFFGVGYRRVAQGTPPDVDWATHRPLTFDVEHTDAVFLVDARGRERLVVPGMVGGMAGRLQRPLRSLLSATGRFDLTHPRLAGWTTAGIMRDVRYLLAHPSPAAPS